MAYLERKQNTFKENNIPYVKNYYELMEILKGQKLKRWKRD
jgi:hypothetical protein